MSQPHRPQAQDAAVMRRALELGAQGPLADPNPRVGAVVVGPDGRVVGEGAHAGAGTPHAEVVALADAGPAARGGTAYVTLEPCDHSGRTGPCSSALLAAGIRRVVFGQRDPNPVARGGAATLQAAGVATTGGVLEAECRALNEPWTLAVSRGRPFVTWKLACTLDGRSAAADGTSRWITSVAAREDVHDLRATCGAVLVGTGTVLADDPWLTVRHADGTLRERQPLRVVMGLRPVPPGARVLDDAADTLVLAERDPETALKTLHDKDIRHVWLEGGPRVAASFLRAGLVDEVIAYVAPALLGGGAAAVGDLGIPTIDRAVRLVFTDVARVGPDVRLRARPTSDEPATHTPTHPTGDQ